MTNLVYHIVFLLFTLYAFIKTTAYALYEIRQQKNKIGGISLILFTLTSVIFSNIVMWIN